MDPLSDLLSLCKPRSYVSGGFNLTSHTAIQWPKHDGIKCYAVVSGQCWLSVEGISDAVLLTAGDCYLLPPGAPFRLATYLSVTPIDYETLNLTQRLDVSLYRALGGGWEKTVQKLPNPDVSTTPPPLPGALDWVADPDS